MSRHYIPKQVTFEARQIHSAWCDLCGDPLEVIHVSTPDPFVADYDTIAIGGYGLRRLLSMDPAELQLDMCQLCLAKLRQTFPRLHTAIKAQTKPRTPK